MTRAITSTDYRSLAELRHQIRCFLHFSEQAARKAGLEPRQHQFLLALKGLPVGARPRIAEMAERLQIQHHSTVELVDRLAARGFVRRDHHGTDRREVFVCLTPKANQILGVLSLHHKKELALKGPALVAALRKMMSGTTSRQRKSGGQAKDDGRAA